MKGGPMFKLEPCLDLRWGNQTEPYPGRFLLVKVIYKKPLNTFQKLSNLPSYWGHIPNAINIKGRILCGHECFDNRTFKLRMSKYRIMDINCGETAIMHIIGDTCLSISQCPNTVNKSNFSKWIETATTEFLQELN